MNNTINWNEYFDHIFVISRCINFDRRKFIDEQFAKFGITNYQYWYVPDYDLENSQVFKYDSNKLVEHQRCTLGHYTLWKTCHELNYDKILIFEDDIIFKDDIELIHDMLNIYKESNSDIYLFEYTLRSVSEEFKSYTNSGGYALNKNGLKYLIKNHEKYNSLSDQYWYQFDTNKIDINLGYTIKLSITNNYNVTLFYDKEDLQIKLNISPDKFCYQV